MIGLIIGVLLGLHVMLSFYMIAILYKRGKENHITYGEFLGACLLMLVVPMFNIICFIAYEPDNKERKPFNNPLKNRM